MDRKVFRELSSIEYAKKLLKVDSSQTMGDGWREDQVASLILMILDLWPVILSAGLAAGDGKGWRAIIGVACSTVGLFCIIKNHISPLILSIISIILSFAGLLLVHLDYSSGVGIIYDIYLVWASICCAVCSSSAIWTLLEIGAIPDINFS